MTYLASDLLYNLEVGVQASFCSTHFFFLFGLRLMSDERHGNRRENRVRVVDSDGDYLFPRRFH